jgi:GTP-binding protein
MDDVKIGDTVVDAKDPKPLPPIVVEEPTVVMEIGVNKSPLGGQTKNGKFTAAMIKARLEKEVLTNLALRLEPGSSAESFRVKGRGTLQLGILMENMRRENFEIMVGAPEIILRKDPETGKKQEPYEEVVIEVPAEYQGVVMEEMSKKGGEMKSMEAAAVESSLVFTFSIPTRNLIGMQGKFAQRTSGSAVMTSQFEKWGDYLEGSNRIRDHGAITTTADGKATFYSIHNSQPRGKFFVEPGEEVYTGMVIGIHSKEQDLEINVTKEKATTNVRASGQTAQTIPPKIRMSLDDWLGHMDTDECLEITPSHLRLCKKNSKSLKVRN